MMRMTDLPRCCMLVAALLAGGCAKGPPPAFYMLDTPAAMVSPGPGEGSAIGILPVELPAHLDRREVVSRSSAVQLDVAERAEWAEPLQDGVARVLAKQLALAVESNRVYLLPEPQRPALDYLLAVNILRFDGAPGGDVVLESRWSVLSSDGRTVLISRASRIGEPVDGADVAALVRAHSRAAARLGEEIGAAIRAMPLAP